MTTAGSVIPLRSIGEIVSKTPSCTQRELSFGGYYRALGKEA